MHKYFGNTDLLQNTLLPYFCEEEPLKLLNKLFWKLDYEKYNTHIQPHGIKETYYVETKIIEYRKTYKNGKLNGLYEQWRDDDTPVIKCYYKNGKLNGLYKSWWSNGQLSVTKIYENGKLNGLLQCRCSDGKLHRMNHYRNGILEE